MIKKQINYFSRSVGETILIFEIILFLRGPDCVGGTYCVIYLNPAAKLSQYFVETLMDTLNVGSNIARTIKPII